MGRGEGAGSPSHRHHRRHPRHHRHGGGLPPRQVPWPLILLACAAVLVLLMSFRAAGRIHAHSLLDSSAEAARTLLARGGTIKTLSYEVCGSFAHQRLSVVYGLLLAKLLGRSPVLPTLQMFGAQMAVFESVYDLPALNAALAAHGLAPLTPAQQLELPRAGASVAVQLPGARAPMRDAAAFMAAAGAGGAQHVSCDCPLFAINADVVLAHRDLFTSLLGALRLSPSLEPHVKAAHERAGGGAFNFLHLRMDRGWQAGCDRWRAADAAASAGLNCFNSTLGLAEALSSMGFDKGVKLYVAADWAATDEDAAAGVLREVGAAGYAAVRSAPRGRGVAREIAAHAHFELAMRAERFLGSGASAFSALVVLQRRAAGAWAGHYTGGEHPLLAALPLAPVPWVFAFAGWAGAPQLAAMKAAVNSALSAGGVAPHCLFAGDAASAPAAAWLKAKGVKLLPHAPAWRGRLAGALKKAAGGAEPAAAEVDALVSRWLHLDVPLLPWVDMHTHVLVSEANVLFRRGLDPRALPRPPPRAAALPPPPRAGEAAALGAAAAAAAARGGGLAYVNLPALRASHAAFVDFVMGDTAGAGGRGFGGDDSVGAYHAFYKAAAAAPLLPPALAARPWSADPPRYSDAAVILFDGPTPDDYMHFAIAGDCPPAAGGAAPCRAGVDARACAFAREFVAALDPEDAAPAQALWASGCGRRAATPAEAGAEAPAGAGAAPPAAQRRSRAQRL
ncbi:MAG: hypothetical protein J3K34DRAFT_482354 [Monoraphidium minutum]|nr:MAG: hypothetical protein J3K34DRAFT_482354 [Monoraphidium minutum]